MTAGTFSPQVHNVGMLSEFDDVVIGTFESS